MFKYEKINELFKSKVFIKEEFFQKIGMTRVGFNLMMQKHSLKVDTLEKFAFYFKKPISYFFEEEIPKENITNEEATEYDQVDYKTKYIDCLEKFNKTLDELNELRKEK